MEFSSYFKMKYDAEQKIPVFSTGKTLRFTSHSGSEKYTTKYGCVLPYGDFKIRSKVAFENLRTTTLNARFSTYCEKGFFIKVNGKEFSTHKTKSLLKITLECKNSSKRLDTKKSRSLNETLAEYQIGRRIIRNRITPTKSSTRNMPSDIVKSKPKKSENTEKTSKRRFESSFRRWDATIIEDSERRHYRHFGDNVYKSSVHKFMKMSNKSIIAQRNESLYMRGKVKPKLFPTVPKM